MRYVTLCSTMLLSVLWAHSSASDVVRLGWAALVDEAAQEFDDPYAALSPEQLSDLVTVVRLRERLESEDIDPDPRARIRARLDDTEATLTDAGVDVDWILSQRWIVAERREAAAMSGNPSVDGLTVTMRGFAIPAPPDADGSEVAYLVPERGMCSHMPPPNPNQMIRIRYPDGERVHRMHEPVQVTGRIDIAPSEQVMRVVDGIVPMRATFALEAETLQSLAQKPIKADGGATSTGAASIAERLRASDSAPPHSAPTQ
ncbi:MAG: DUF3299 domain-containing protein [Rhodobacteraceae bacterium]|nr:DUF3299 domain-containing protein [Paracoccaceae bacterium]